MKRAALPNPERDSSSHRPFFDSLKNANLNDLGPKSQKQETMKRIEAAQNDWARENNRVGWSPKIVIKINLRASMILDTKSKQLTHNAK